MLHSSLLQDTMVIALPFMNLTSDITTHENPHIAHILHQTTDVRPMPIEDGTLRHMDKDVSVKSPQQTSDISTFADLGPTVTIPDLCRLFQSLCCYTVARAA